jgi:hypothetical protein
MALMVTRRESFATIEDVSALAREIAPHRVAVY